MQYLGGKSKIRFAVAGLVHAHLRGRNYFEPFVGGGLGVTGGCSR